jgi:hypothetical protein
MLYPWPRLAGLLYEDFTVTYNHSVNFVMPAGCTRVDLVGQGRFGNSDGVVSITFMSLGAVTPATQGSSTPATNPYDGTSLDQIYNTINTAIAGNNGSTTRRFTTVSPFTAYPPALNYKWLSNTPSSGAAPDLQSNAFFPYDNTNPQWQKVGPNFTYFSNDGSTYEDPQGMSVIGSLILQSLYFPGPPSGKAWAGTGAMTFGNAPTNPPSSNIPQGLYFNDPGATLHLPLYAGDPNNASIQSNGRYVFGFAGGALTGFGFTWNGSSYTPPSPNNSLSNRGLATRPATTTHSGVSVSPGTTYPIVFSAQGNGGFITISGRKIKGAPVVP